ncbi:MAG: hypothetical protein WAK23_13655 [Terriglobales bacterium]
MTNQEQQIMLLWASVMPTEVNPPSEQHVFTWASSHPMEDIIDAVTQTGKKMAKNIAMGIPLEDDSAVRYTCGILGHKAEWQRELARRRAANAAAVEQRRGQQ